MQRRNSWRLPVFLVGILVALALIVGVLALSYQNNAQQARANVQTQVFEIRLTLQATVTP